MPKVLILVLFTAVVAGGCSGKSQCDKLAAAVCRGGETTECANIKRLATDADDESQAVCQQISVLLPASGKALNDCDKLAAMVCSERSLQECLNMYKEAAGADVKKVGFCTQLKAMIENTRKTSAERADEQRAAIDKQKAAEASAPSGPAPVNATADAPAAAPVPVPAGQPSETN